MQIQAINSVSFNGAEKPADNKHQNFFIAASKSALYDARRLSEGREEKDGKYKTVQAGFALASFGAFFTGIFKNIKSSKLFRQARKAAATSSNERLNELKAASMQKSREAKSAVILGLGLLLVSRIIHSLNIFDSAKSLKERGFMSDDEIELKLLAKKVEKDNNKNKQEPDNEDNKKPAR